jgi:phosphonate transport system substrate-binding protein
MNRTIHKALAVLAIGGVLAACGSDLDDTTDPGSGGADDGGSGDDSGDDSRADWPETVQYGLLPTDDVNDLVSRFTPFEEYMAGCLDHPFKLFTGTDYTAMVEAMRTGSIHVSRFGPFSYILAHERAGAEALVIAVADEDEPTYQSLIISLEGNGIDSLEDLEGTTFAFVDPTSSSGHLYPRAMIINELGISNDDVESWFGDVNFAGNHEASLLSVLNGDTDAGALASNSSAVELVDGEWKMVEDSDLGDHPAAGDFMVVHESDPIPPTVEAIRDDLPESLKEAVTTCFLEIVDVPELAGFREDLGIADGFIPTMDSNYDVVRDTADALGMGPDDLLGQ